MTPDREIVLMLILRSRSAHKRMRRQIDKNDSESHLMQITTEWAEANNAAELARRILYSERGGCKQSRLINELNQIDERECSLKAWNHICNVIDAVKYNRGDK